MQFQSLVEGFQSVDTKALSYLPSHWASAPAFELLHYFGKTVQVQYVTKSFVPRIGRKFCVVAYW